MFFSQKLSPFTGKVDTNGCEWPKGERLKAAKCCELFPLSLTSFDSSPPYAVEPFWYSANTAYSAVPLAERSFQRGYGGRQGA